MDEKTKGQEKNICWVEDSRGRLWKDDVTY